MPPTLPPDPTPPPTTAPTPSRPLRYGWTTGACATAAAKAAYTALLTGDFPDPVRIHLPKNHQPAFALTREHLTPAHPAPTSPTTTGSADTAPEGVASAGQAPEETGHPGLEPASTGSGSIERVATERVATERARTEHVTTEHVTTERVATERVTTGPVDIESSGVGPAEGDAPAEPGSGSASGGERVAGAGEGAPGAPSFSARDSAHGAGGASSDTDENGRTAQADSPGGGTAGLGEWESAMAGVVKDAGDDPDVTHGALVMATVRRGEPGSGVTFRAGPGVGTVTKPGLPLAVGEPAINPVPRRMMREHIEEVAALYGDPGDVVIEISIENGEELARHTWNPRLGILGGLSVLGTTGVVVPYSCSAWIDSIRRGIDVARAAGHTHVAGCTGSTSELVAKNLYDLPDDALLDMGDFAGAVLKYLRRHPVPRLTIAGGVGKLAKLADGHLDLHSGRSQVNKDFLATLAMEAGATDTLATEIRTANTALAALHLSQAAGVPLADRIAAHARRTAEHVLREAPVTVDVIVIDRAGTIVGRA
ncbi:cobalt-precorrin-5B (C(1))-methyltransferase [Actinocorallia longicatena]|uniref:Cobalt-precorrin-5B C(1)-methyltransferase n=1 Tax=Actinocorallia longicatena TaxID=111803 RepID=A0ABP6QAZ2_9ACTN